MSSLSLIYLNNIRDLLEELQNSEQSSLRTFGYHRIKLGEALMIEQGEFPMICISLSSIDNETSGLGHGSRRDSIYTIDISIYASEIMQDFKYEDFYGVLDEIYDWITLKASNIVYNIDTGAKANSGKMPEIGDVRVTYEKKIIGDAFGMVICGKLPVIIQSHKMRSNSKFY